MKALRLIVLLGLVGDWTYAVMHPYPVRSKDEAERVMKDIERMKERRAKVRAELEAKKGKVEENEENEDEWEEVEVEEGLISQGALVVGGIALGAVAVAYGFRKLFQSQPKSKSFQTSRKFGKKSDVVGTSSRPAAFTSKPSQERPAPISKISPMDVVPPEEAVTKTTPPATPAPIPQVSKPAAAEEPAATKTPQLVEKVEVKPNTIEVPLDATSEPELEKAEKEGDEEFLIVGEEMEEENIFSSELEGTEEAVKKPFETVQPSTSNISPGGSSEAPPATAAIELSILETEPDDNLPPSPFTTLLGPTLLRGLGEKGKLQKVHTAKALAGKTVGVFFHGKKLNDVLKEKGPLDVVARIAAVYEKTRKDGNNFEMVFCSLDPSESDFAEFFNEMPWLSFPQCPIEEKLKYVEQFQLEAFPSIVILNEEGVLLTNKGLTAMISDPEGFPWIPQPIRQVLGGDFVDNMGNGHASDAVDNKIIGLYFSAHWCPPCKQFTPLLAKTYEKLKAQGKDFEIIYISSDKDEASFNEYLAQMPWLAIPFADQSRRSKLQVGLAVQALPTLVILDKDGSIISQNGRSSVSADPDGLEFPWYPKPLKNLSLTADGLGEGPALIAFAEGASKEEQERLIGILTPIAEKNVAEQKPFGFFYSTEPSQVGSLLRKMCGQAVEEGQESTKPVLALLDLAGKSFLVCEANVIDASTVSTFLSDFEQGKLKMNEIDLSAFQTEPEAKSEEK